MEYRKADFIQQLPLKFLQSLVLGRWAGTRLVSTREASLPEMMSKKKKHPANASYRLDSSEVLCAYGIAVIATRYCEDPLLPPPVPASSRGACSACVILSRLETPLAVNVF